MSDLISRSALIEKLKKSIKWCEDNLESSTASFQSGCIAAIKDVISTVKMEETCPSVDAVEVVRCENCMSFDRQHEYGGYCYHWLFEQGCEPNIVDNDDYCSYGERKEVSE